MPTKATFVTFTVQPDGNDLNGGAFKRGASGTDASGDDDPICTIDGSTITASTYGDQSLNVVGYDVSSSDVGNCLFGQMDDSSSHWVQTGPIASVDTTNNRWTWDQDQSWAWISGATEFTSARLGGALATPGGLADPSGGVGRMGNDCVAYIKAGTYTMTSSDAESQGRFQAGSRRVSLVAYKTTPGDHFENTGDLVIIDTGSTANDSNGVIYFSNDDSLCWVTGVEVRGNDTWSTGFSGRCSVSNCVAKNLTGCGFSLNPVSTAFSSRAVDCGTSGTNSGFSSGFCTECIAIDCEASGFRFPVGAVRCVSHGGTNGFELYDFDSATACVADGASVGFKSATNVYDARVTNSVAINCTTGLTNLADGGGNAFYNNTANFSTTNSLTHVNEKQLTADPFNDAPNQDYTINSDSGGGADLAERSPKFGAGVSEGGPQQQQSAQLKSTGGGSSTVVAPGPVQIGM